MSNSQEHQQNQNLSSNASPQRRQKRKDDFILGKKIGHGAFGSVIKVQDKETERFYAMKILKKSQIQKEHKIHYVTLERDCMKCLNHPNIIRLYLTFQDNAFLYYVVELAENGDLQNVLNDIYSIDIPQTKIIMGQTLLALCAIHSKKIIHRDLKPENILLDSHNRAKITDFGTAKMFQQNQPFFCQRGSFVGSADYVSPETLKETPVGPETDLWSFGCTIYQLIVGQAPFHTDSNYSTFQLIDSCKYDFPSFVPEDAKDLISKLLVIDPSKRLGSGEWDKGYPSIKNHPFFSGIDWETLPTTPIEQFKPFLPSVEEAKLMHGSASFGQLKKELFDNDEVVIKEGLVVYGNTEDEEEPRMMIITDIPRLLILNMEKNKVITEIPLSNDLKLTIDGNKINMVSQSTNTNKSVKIDADDIQQWFTTIKEAVDTFQ